MSCPIISTTRGFTAILLLLSFVWGLSQSIEGTVITYEYKSEIFEVKTQKDVYLYIKGDSVLYEFKNFKKDSKTDTLQLPGGITNVKNISGNKKENSKWIFKNLYKEQLFEEADFGYTVKDTLNAIRWEILQDKKQIDSINCQKAISNFRGRNYIAWFSSQYPISVGPWKLDGLPGIIVEVYTDDRNYYWKLARIDYNSEKITVNFKEIISEEILNFKNKIIDPRSYFLIDKSNKEERIKNQIKYMQTQYGQENVGEAKSKMNFREYFD